MVIPSKDAFWDWNLPGNKWFQRVCLGNGKYSDAVIIPDPARYGIPDSLTGMDVLDVGCAEGFFSFLAEERGARRVLGIDMIPKRVKRFRYAAERRGSRCRARVMNVYDVSEELGSFDVVFFFAVYHHLRHPMLALERLFSVLRPGGLLLTECLYAPELQEKAALFAEGGFKGDTTTWWIPSLECLVANQRSVGLEDIEVVNVAQVVGDRVTTRARKP